MLEWDEVSKESNKLLSPFSCEILDGAYSLLAKTGGRSLFSFYIRTVQLLARLSLQKEREVQYWTHVSS